MWENFDVVRDRLSSYKVYPEAKYKTVRGLPMQEQNLEQKVRQYWADKSISNAEKLKGFDLDLSKFDPRNTNNMELRKISNALESLGIVDQSTGGWFGGANLEFNSLGNEINKYKKVDLIEYFDGHLEFYKRELSSGYSIVKDAQTSLYTAISVLQALKEYALEVRANSLVDTTA
ncbi:hypothetical protein [Pseudomonas sp. NA-150]|uniref:hypothetical protein n=1 Tax=Pseudomonas sp. NA-150 TaxID=3367525 RepID=UPI0037C65ED6